MHLLVHQASFLAVFGFLVWECDEETLAGDLQGVSTGRGRQQVWLCAGKC